MGIRRRSILQAVGTLAGGAALTGKAQTESLLSSMKSVGIFALLGDQVQVAVSDAAPTDSRIERTNRDTLNFRGIGFDDIALRQANGWLKNKQPALNVHLYRSNATIKPDEQQAVAEGATRGELPAWIVQAVVAKQIDHVLLITRMRGPIEARSAGPGSTTVGRGTVQGLGFYIDVFFKTRNMQTGAINEGLIAPYAQIKVSLMNTAEAKVVASYAINDAFIVGSADNQVVADPWAFVDNTEKVRLLRKLVADGMDRAMPQLFRA
jgi:hypothetical protein